METPLHCIKLLDKEKRILVPSWTFITTAFLTSLGYFLTILSKVSDGSFLSNLVFARKNSIVFVLKYLDITSIEVGEFYAR
ncbi:MAG: hypothetical protein HPY60_09375 [Candidatus Methanofastidiosum sp.]|nr:hypothetical protein [Methanofastidiosum sp.]NYT04221.1 hypothetical protein [Candidatus Methanofastidiosa archaeon]NYT13819.1 hypothetical protein [Candidatus Methanofastidiosa archaeon]